MYEPKLFEIRLSKRANALIDTIEHGDSVSKRLTALAELLNADGFRERYQPTEYDTHTGNPTKHDWVSQKEYWDGKFGRNHNGQIGPISIHEFFDGLPSTPLVFVIGNKAYCIMYMDEIGMHEYFIVMRAQMVTVA